MSKKEYLWCVQLRKSHLKGALQDTYTADVLTNGESAHNEDIARTLSNKGIGNYNTILAILNARDKEVREVLAGGRAFADTNIQLFPRVTGVWTDGMKKAGDANKLTFDLRLLKALKDTLSLIEVKNCGKKRELAYLVNIENCEDTENIIAGGYVRLTGKGLKIDETDDEQGVFLVDADGAERKITRLGINQPSEIMCRLPTDIASGEYLFVVRTRYNHGQRALQTIRSVQYYKRVPIASLG